MSSTVTDPGPQGPNWFANWEIAVLNALGAPVNQDTVGWLAKWHSMDISGDNPPALNNPLDVTGYPPIPVTIGTQSINKAGVQSFSSPQQGVAATAAWLNMPNYVALKAALMSGNPTAYERANGSQTAPALYKWSGGGYTSIGFDSPRNFGSSGGFLGVGGSGSPAAGVYSAGKNAVTTTISAAKSTGDFLGQLSNPNLWIRIAEVVGGVLLVGLGLYVTLKDMGMDAPKLPGPLGTFQDKSADQVRSMELENRTRAAESRSTAITLRTETQSSEFENRQKVARERYLQARARTRERRANAKAAESGATAASRRAERAKSIQMEEIESLGIFK